MGTQNFAMIHNIGAFVEGVNALDAASITAGAGNDGQVVAGNIIDRLLAGRTLCQSGKLLVPFTTVLTAAKTLTVTAVVKWSDDAAMASPTTLKTYAATAVASGGQAGATVRGCAALDFDLGGAGRYIQASVTADLSHTSTDTVALAGVIVLGGANELPPV